MSSSSLNLVDVLLDAHKLSYRRNGTEQVLVENPQARVVSEILA